MKYVMLAVFILSSLIHLYASYKKDKKLRSFTKVFIVASLLGWYLAASGSPKTVTALALFFSWLGDVLLIPSGTAWFVSGGIAFMVSHVLFIFSYLPNIDFGKIGLLTAVLTAAVYVAVVVLVFSRLKGRLPKKLGPAMFAYLLINGAMNCFAFWQLLSTRGMTRIVNAVPVAQKFAEHPGATVSWLAIPAAVTFAGAVLFFISDTLLFFVRTDKDAAQRSHFHVMLTYILGEFLIVLGLLMLNG